MRQIVLATTVIAAMVLAGCRSTDTSQPPGDAGTQATPAGVDASGAAAAADGSDISGACDAVVAVNQAFNVDEDLQAGLAALEAFVAAAPGDVASDVEPIISLFQQDPEAALESEEIVVAEQAADGFAYQMCGDARFDVQAHNFAFTGVPPELEAGRTAFRLTNQTQTGEFHEALLLSKADTGNDTTAHDLLASGLATPVSAETTLAAFEPFEFIGVGFVEPEGKTDDVFIVDLRPGEYVIACLLPVNSPELLEPYFGGEDVTGERHFDLGMYVEFTVE